ncbi:hypothetical protein [Nocardioides sp. TF02-7]|uniref:hypothetical protein n=1 Tax=Nocardioides sp. TF02-7 TaxID=2917724 RepID=UPI001F05ABBE|nr:hypothetical protein [Nocardioides sp. TF02-7]UMG91684.1 hypothetical protein MF408_16590 [Nocardioides sp. TF02-7]
MPVLSAASDTAGRVLSVLTLGLAKARPADKPLHPEGQLRAGRLVRNGTRQLVGVPWLDRPGEHDVLVRVSRAVGFPRVLPDVEGLALRMELEEDGYADLLLANTGWDRLTRHLLFPGWSGDRPLTTLLPYRTAAGPVVIGARRTGDIGYALFWARVGGGWVPLGKLILGEPLDDTADVSFDPVLHQLPGLDQYPWVVRLRERSYLTARAERGD